MNKFLPKTLKNSQGFTLVELMVVIAIIAILSVVGFGIFNGVQGNARDSRRTLEVDSIAKNIESTRDPLTGRYTYSGALFGRDYPTGLLDPDGVSTYCVFFSATPITAPTSNPTGSTGLLCPATAGSAVRGGGASGGYAVLNSALTAQTPALYYSVCSVRAERGTKPICRGNFLR